MTTKEAVKKGLLLLGSFEIAYNLSEFLHELGHAIAAWTTGGQVFGIVIHPFNWSYCSAVSPNQLFLTSGGVLLSSLAGFLVFLGLIRWPKYALLPLLLVGPITLINNGDYLLMDLLVQSGGDACSLVAMGVPSVVIIFGATLLLLTGFALSIFLVRKTRLLNGGFKVRLIIISLGILPSLFMALIWNFFYDRSAALEWLAYTASGTVMTFLFAAIAGLGKKKEPPLSPAVNWKPIIAINVSAVMLIVFLLVGPRSGNIKNAITIETFSERPDDFPSILVPPADAVEASYVRSRNPDYPSSYFLFYKVPTSTSPDQIVQYLSNLHREQGYILLTHQSDDPNKLNEHQWREYDSIKGYTEEWIKIETSIFRSSPAIFMYQDNALFSARVMHPVTKGWDPDQIEAYIMMHPEQFNAEQIEYLRQSVAQTRQSNQQDTSGESKDDSEKNK